jgi:hypothetical protein
LAFLETERSETPKLMRSGRLYHRGRSLSAGRRDRCAVG